MSKLYHVLFVGIVFCCQMLFAEEPIKVVSTTAMISDLASNILGSSAEVRSLMGTGVDPHLYRPSRSDISTLSSADLVIYNGLHLEGRMVDAIERIKDSGRKVIALGDYLPRGELLVFQDGAAVDPHIWMDPDLWRQCLVKLSHELVEMYPQHKELIEKNTTQYEEKLKNLDQYIKNVISGISPDKRILVTAHDAFSYFGKRYGLEVYSIQGVSTDSESGLREIENLVKIIVGKKIGAVFYETTVSEKSISALKEGVIRSGGEVRIGGNLFSDAMGENGTYRGTYIGMIDSNVTEIGIALGSAISAKGLNGEL